MNARKLTSIKWNHSVYCCMWFKRKLSYGIIKWVLELALIEFMIMSTDMPTNVYKLNYNNYSISKNDLPRAIKNSQVWQHFKTINVIGYRCIYDHIDIYLDATRKWISWCLPDIYTIVEISQRFPCILWISSALVCTKSLYRTGVWLHFCIWFPTERTLWSVRLIKADRPYNDLKNPNMQTFLTYLHSQTVSWILPAPNRGI